MHGSGDTPNPTFKAGVPALLGGEHGVWAGQGGGSLGRRRAEDVVGRVQPGIDGLIIVARHAAEAAGVPSSEGVLGVVQTGYVGQVCVHRRQDCCILQLIWWTCRQSQFLSALLQRSSMVCPLHLSDAAPLHRYIEMRCMSLK